MRRKIQWFLVMVIFLSLVACAAFEINTYRSLYVGKTFYYTAMGAVSDFQAKGKIDQTKRDEINKYARIYKEAHEVARSAFEVYKKTQLATDKDKVSVAMGNAASKWREVASLINAIEAGTVEPELPK